MGVCKPLCSANFDKLQWLTDPKPDAFQPGHFKGFAEVKGMDTKEDHCPSLNAKAQRRQEPCLECVCQHLRATVKLVECEEL